MLLSETQWYCSRDEKATMRNERPESGSDLRDISHDTTAIVSEIAQKDPEIGRDITNIVLEEGNGVCGAESIVPNSFRERKNKMEDDASSE
jgi:hypothetical protein